MVRDVLKPLAAAHAVRRFCIMKRWIPCVLMFAVAWVGLDAQQSVNQDPSVSNNRIFLGAAPGSPKEEEAKIEGLEIVRPGGGYLGLQVIRNNLVISFYDKDRKSISADVERATARWPVNYQPNDERTVLNRSPDGMTLTSAKVVRPPLRFRIYLSLFAAGNEQPVESHVVDYRGE